MAPQIGSVDGLLKVEDWVDDVPLQLTSDPNPTLQGQFTREGMSHINIIQSACNI